ncbi:Ferric reductase transmembrane component 3 [Yarrowia sp. C11]|nr:Ferric reductase transmembrane component 3 [Yarrowia sp. C11]
MLVFSLQLLLLTTTAWARPLLTDRGYRWQEACTEALAYVPFDSSNSRDISILGTRCHYQPALGSVLLCIHRNTIPEELDWSYRSLIENCQEKGYYLTQTDLFYAWMNASDYEDTSYELPTSPTNGPLVRTPVSVPVDVFTTYFWVIDEAIYYTNFASYYSYGLGFFWAMVFFVGVISNFIAKNAHNVTARFFAGKKTNIVRRHFFMSALGSLKHNVPLSIRRMGIMAVPTRAQFVVTFIYVFAEIIYIFIGLAIAPRDLPLQDLRANWIKSIANRSGGMAVTQVPWIFLFAGRNNILMWMTGWGFDTFNVFHRWIARMCVLHALIHTVAYAMSAHNYNFLEAGLHLAYFKWGIAATVCCVAICIQAFYYFRHWKYEVFLALHIVLALFFLIGVWIHIDMFHWCEYVYAAGAVWIFDRFMRLFRIWWSGLCVVGDFQIADEKAKIMRITIDYSQMWEVYPGAHLYLYVLNSKRVWENHPFTVYQSPQATRDGRLSLMVRAKEGKTKELFNAILASETKAVQYNCLVEGPYGNSHPVHKYDTCIIMAGGIGVTAAYAYAVSCLNQERVMGRQKIVFVWVLPTDEALEWFKPELDFLQQFGNVEIELYFTSKKYRQQENEMEKMTFNNPRSPVVSPAEEIVPIKDDVIVSILPVSPYDRDALPPRKSSLLRQPKLNSRPRSVSFGQDSPMRYYTGDTPLDNTNYVKGYFDTTSSRNSTIQDYYLEESDSRPHTMGTTYGRRPDMNALVSKYFEECRGTCSVTICAAPAMNDDVRSAVTNNMDKCKGRVDYFEESFSW